MNETVRHADRLQYNQGYRDYITREILDEMKEIGCCPQMKISFDGVGTHDWMRGRSGAEESALKAVKLVR